MFKAKRPGIDISAVLLCKPGAVPQRISIHELEGLPLVKSIPGFVTGLSGHQRMQGLMYAREYADAKKLEMIVVDMLVNFEKPIYPKVLPPEELPNHDVVSLFRASKALIADIAEYWQEWISEERGKRIDYDWSRPSDFVARRPDLIARLLEQPEFAHIKVITYPAMVKYHSEPVTVSSFRVAHAVSPGGITSASVRFHAGIEVVV